MPVILGCIADDITGGTDIALTLFRAGMRVILVREMADRTDMPDADAVVIALKVRTAPTDLAIGQSIEAARNLKRWGALQLYFKYCSTFDSTSDGNIGPIAIALADEAEAAVVPFCPSFPANGRTVYNGHLFVNGQLLSESSMKDHPLTPMTDSDVTALLRAQSSSQAVGLVDLRTVEAGVAAIKQTFQGLQDEGTRFVVVDALFDRHLRDIAQACDGLPLLTGGSALAMGLPDNYRRSGLLDGSLQPENFVGNDGPVLILSGSCSQATQVQVAHAATNMPVIKLSPARLLAGGDEIDRVTAEARKHLHSGAVLIASTDTPQAVADFQARAGIAKIGTAIENAHAAIARALYAHGVRNYVVAGGETSGAVAAALGLKQLLVGPEVAPGVPLMRDANGAGTHVVFKSGNFGGSDFFADAITMIREGSSGSGASN